MVLDGVLGEVSMQEGGCIASPSSSSVNLFSMLGESGDVIFLSDGITQCITG